MRNRLCPTLIPMLLLGIAGCSTPGDRPAGAAADQSPAELHNRALHRRAIEAVIWGMPAVNFERMLRAAADNGAKRNQVVYWSRPVNAKNQTLTPNPDTIYFNPFYDTTDGPVVMEIPAATEENVIVGSVDNAWQNALEDVGQAGADKGRGGKYLITPPGYKERSPDGYIVLSSDTYRGFVILRSNFKTRADADVTAAVEYGKRIKLYPLGGKAESTVYVDCYDKPFDAAIPYDATYFEYLNRFVQAEPWLTRDKVMIDSLRTIGIEKGKPFNPDAKTKALLADAAREARAFIDAKYETMFDPPYVPGTRWAVPADMDVVSGMGSMFAQPDRYPVDGRAVTYAMGYFSAKHLGAGQFYLMAIADKAGNPLRGTKTYRLIVPANAPVTQYWSATMYDRATHALVRGASRPSLASTTPGLRANADGSTDLYFGPAAPSGKESNWVPTNGRDFEILFRLYGPQKPFFDKAWTLPDLEEVN